IFQPGTPAPQPISPPKNPQHRDATDKSRHIFECGQEGLDIVWELVRGDHQHRDRECERRVDERLQPRHLHPAQSEPAQSGKIIKICGNRGSNLLLTFIHATRCYRDSPNTKSYSLAASGPGPVLPAKDSAVQFFSIFFVGLLETFRIPSFYFLIPNSYFRLAPCSLLHAPLRALSPRRHPVVRSPVPELCSLFVLRPSLPPTFSYSAFG